MNNGRLYDVLIEDESYLDELGLRKFLGCFKVWADAGLVKLISSVEGVTNVYQVLGDTEYSVYLDPRYDREYVKQAIKAAILIGGSSHD